MGVRRTSPVVGLLLAALSAAVAQTPLTDVVRDRRGQVLAQVDWAARRLTAIGRARLDDRTPIAWAERAAKSDAYRSLMLAARLARISGERRVGELAGEDQAFAGYLNGYVRWAEFGELVRGDDGLARITATVPLFGVALGDDHQRLLGTELYQRDDLWAHQVTPHSASTAPYTGVLLDARELGAPGAFCPLVRDETGRVVWQVESAPRDQAARLGAVEYWADWDAARRNSRAGAKPLEIKVLRLDGADPVVAVSDGQRLAPDRRAAAEVWLASWETIRTITPVSPFQQLACTSTARTDAAHGAP